jgi:hypothetical protein
MNFKEIERKCRDLIKIQSDFAGWIVENYEKPQDIRYLDRDSNRTTPEYKCSVTGHLRVTPKSEFS